jgi:DamX protein
MSAKQEPAPARLANASVAEPPESPRAIAVTADGGVHREAWLLKQAPHRYTLQLFGVSRESAVLRFLRTQQLDGPVAYYRTRFKGDDWFVLLHGDYPDANCAREAYAGLPKAARTGRPYPRSMAAVQAGIVAAAESR